MVTEADEAILNSLQDISFEYYEKMDVRGTLCVHVGSLWLSSGGQAVPLPVLTTAYASICLQGFKLLFKFGANDYFTDDVLVKEYGVDSMLRGEPSLLNIEASPINWKAGKNVTVKRVKKKSKRGALQRCGSVVAHASCVVASPHDVCVGVDAGKPVFKEVKVDSFFNFFTDPSSEGMDAAGGEDGEDDDEENDVR